MPAHRLPWLLAGQLSLLLAVCPGCRRNAPTHELVSATDGAVAIETIRVADGKAHFFTYRHEGRNVNFFIRTDGQGTLRAHLDACYSCYKYRRGYVQKGSHVVCLACRIGYDLQTPVWDYVGACVPISLRCQTAPGRLLLPVATLERAARYF